MPIVAATSGTLSTTAESNPIAIAIALKPELVIADEPTTALDVNVQRMIIQTLADLRDEMGMTLIVVTHDMAVHAELADRVAVMYAGDIAEVGDVRQIFKEPRHPYTRALIDSIPKVGGARGQLAGISCQVSGAPALCVVTFSQLISPRFDPFTVTRVRLSAEPVTP